MNIFSIVILLVMALFNGAAFFMSLSNKNPDDYSKFLIYFCLPVAVGCIMMLLKQKLGFVIAAIALGFMILGTHIREGATETPFIIQLILLCLAAYLPKDGDSLWKQLK